MASTELGANDDDAGDLMSSFHADRYHAGDESDDAMESEAEQQPVMSENRDEEAGRDKGNEREEVAVRAIGMIELQDMMNQTFRTLQALRSKAQSHQENANHLMQDPTKQLPGHATLLSSFKEQYMSVYVTAMDGELGKRGPVEDEELLRLHEREMGKCLTQFRSAMAEYETELQANMSQKFLTLQAANTAAHEKNSANRDTLIEDHLKLFSEQMEVFLSRTVEIDMQAMNSHYWSLKAYSLRSFDTALKSTNPTPALTRKMKKEFESELEKKKNDIISGRYQVLQVTHQQMNHTFLLYNRKMHHEMETEPYMDREAAERVHRKFVNELVHGWEDDFCRSMLRKMMQEQFDKLWIELQEVITERDARLKQLVQELHNRYNVYISAIISNEKRRPASAELLTQEHYKVLQTIIDLYNRHPDVEMVGRHLMHVETELRLLIADSFGEIRKVFQALIFREIDQLVQSCRRSYVQSLEKECTKHPPETFSNLRIKHFQLMQQQMDRLEADARVNVCDQEEKYKQQLKSLMEAEFKQKEAEVRQTLAEQAKKKELEDKVQQAKSEAYQYFATETREHLTKMNKVLETDVENAHFVIRKECLALYRSSVPDDAPDDVEAAGQNELNLLVSDEYGRLVKRFVEGKRRDGAVKSEVIPHSAITAASAFSLPETASQQDPESTDEVKERYVQSYATQLRNFIGQNPGANYSQRSEAQAKIAFKLMKEMTEIGVPEKVRDYARRKMDKKWREMRFMNIERAGRN